MTSPVLLISIDTVRQDVFNSDCFPQTWPAIEEDFTRYSNSISGGVATPHAFPTIITGRPVVGNGQFSSNTVTVSEIFDSGTVAFSNNGHLSSERGYERGFTEFSDDDPPTNQDVAPSPTFIDRIKGIDKINNSSILTKLYKKYQVIKQDPPYSKVTHTAETVTDWALSELEHSPPNFLWAHYMDAHKPFIPEQAIDPPKLKISQEKLGELNSYDLENSPPEEKYLELLWELYEANVRYLDKGLGKLFEKLRSFDWYSDALIILVSDHGELFGEHGHMWHPMTADPVDELINVPLAVKYPQGRMAGEVFEHQVQHADIQATVASYINKKVPTPEGTYPLNKPTERITISKSNTSIRVTGPDGYAIRRRDRTVDTFGDPQDKVMERLNNAEFPDVRTSSGVVRGIEDVDRVEQLKALGYR
jgi:membrane-anchored protein YejM (alkaline phosphatase superfamily)